MPAWTLLKISLQQRERDPSLTWQELGKETSRSRQLATRKACSTFPGEGGREAPSIWRGLARGTSPTCGRWWGKPIQQEYKERTGRILRELGRGALFTWRDQEREILIQRQRRTSERAKDLTLTWLLGEQLYIVSRAAFQSEHFTKDSRKKKSKRVACLYYIFVKFVFSFFYFWVFSYLQIKFLYFMHKLSLWLRSQSKNGALPENMEWFILGFFGKFWNIYVCNVLCNLLQAFRLYDSW